MTKKFYATKNRDSDGLWVEALLEAGYIETNDFVNADFIFHDSVHPMIRKFLAEDPTRKNFITPHTPQSWFLWDGIQAKSFTCCNFVAGEVAVRGMKAYGYPYRVEAVGFNRCKVREFTPRRGNDLLIIPAHPDKNGRYHVENYRNIIKALLERILENRHYFGLITLLWSEHRIKPELMKRMKKAGFRFLRISPFEHPAPLLRAIEEIEKSDLVLGCNTAGCVSVAIGHPTVFFGEVGIPYSIPRFAQNSHLYLDELRFPLAAERMTMDEIMAVREAPNEKAEYWKQQNIGGDFDAKKVIDVVREYV